MRVCGCAMMLSMKNLFLNQGVDMKTSRTLRAVCLALMVCSAVPSGAKELSWVENLAVQDAKFEAKVKPLAAKIEAANPKLMADLKRFQLGARDVAKTLGQQATDLVFVPTSPCRAVETRDIGGPFAANQTRNYDMAGSASSSDFTDQVTGANGATPCAVTALNTNITGSVPKAVLVAISVIGPSNAGFLNAWASGSVEPVVATMLFNGGGLASTFAVVPVCQSGTAYCGDEISLKVAGATAHIAVDIYGYFAPPQATPLDCETVAMVTPTPAVGVQSATATCSAGYIITGGSCDTNSSASKPITGSSLSGNGWRCETNNYPGNTIAVGFSGAARCCRVPGR
jgi:hypothetical protein